LFEYSIKLSKFLSETEAPKAFECPSAQFTRPLLSRNPLKSLKSIELVPLPEPSHLIPSSVSTSDNIRTG
jgi:hypothetical protein